MKLLFLFGNAAVGKMTVGQELAQRTGLRLFHNHIIIEPVLEVFGFFQAAAIRRLRDVIFEEFAASDAYGIILAFPMENTIFEEGAAAGNAGKGTTLARREGGAPAVRRALCRRDRKTGKEAVGLFPGFGFRRQSACLRRWAMRSCPACTPPAKRGVRRQSRARPHRPRTRVRRAARARSIQASPPAR